MQEQDRREIRVFISSTFVDFQGERRLLAERVFPSLNRRARERGLELVDVDLRWGVTAEQTEKGETLPICLGEIDRCRPYFIGLLGERYGWIPPTKYYRRDLLEREDLQWLKDHQGGASVTELEIMHGVLNDRNMAGRAFFYFRDPAWSRAQEEPGFVCSTRNEEAKLTNLKQRIRTSGFPVAENLADPQAIADLIEADLWALIDEQYPNLGQADALEQEDRKHASYRQGRTGVYLGGEGYIQQLEHWIQAGEQKILITGESGSGKSALIANWMKWHGQENTMDFIFAHHLGCSNDANAIRPLLARMLDTSSRLLIEQGLISNSIEAPEDWWELTAKIAETLMDLGRWCQLTGYQWIWVLDGLDRLDLDDQQALPWLPPLIPKGVIIVSTALDCPARTILQKRGFGTLEIGPLQRPEQEELIDCYLGRYTKKLTNEYREQILTCPMAASPMFLRVLLEELRQCGLFETLQDQIAHYTRPNADGALAVDDLFGRILERIESDGKGDNVRKVMTALWASRAGLTEPELLEFTGLAPLQWAPIDLALEQSLGRNRNRLVFDHDFLRIAVRDRYLPSKKDQTRAHSDLADWLGAKDEWDSRVSEELPWQLQKAERLADLREILISASKLHGLTKTRGNREIANYWRTVRADNDKELDELIAEELEHEIHKRRANLEALREFAVIISDLFEALGYYREALLKLRYLSLEAALRSSFAMIKCTSLEIARVANALDRLSLFENSRLLYEHFYGEMETLSPQDSAKLLLAETPLLPTLESLAEAFRLTGLYGKAKNLYSGLNGVIYSIEQATGDQKFDLLLKQAILELDQYDIENQSICSSHQPFLLQARGLLADAARYAPSLLTRVELKTLKAKQLSVEVSLRECNIEQLNNDDARLLFEKRITYLGENHPDTIDAEWLLARTLCEKSKYEDFDCDDFDFDTPHPGWVRHFLPICEKYANVFGENHPLTISRLSEYANLCQSAGLPKESLRILRAAYNRALLFVPEDHPTISKIRQHYARLLGSQGNHKASIDILEKEYTIAKRKEQNEASFPILACKIDIVEACIEAGFDHKAHEYLVDLAYHSCIQLGCDHPITLHTLLATSNLRAFPNQQPSRDIGCFYELIFAIRDWNIDNYFKLQPVSFSDLIFLALGDRLETEKIEPLLQKHTLSYTIKNNIKPALLLNDLSTLHWLKGDFDQAISMIGMALEAVTSSYGKSHYTALRLLDKLGVYLRDAGELDKSIEVFETTYQRRRDLLGENSFDTIYSKANIARCTIDRGDPSLLHQLLESRAVLTEHHDDYLRGTIHQMVSTLFWSYRFEKNIGAIIEPFLVEPRALELDSTAANNILAHIDISCSLSCPN